VTRARLNTIWVAALIAALALAGVALAAHHHKKRMVSTKLGPRLCETVGGGKFVDIPEFPGERIDRRLLTDLGWLEAKYKVFVTDAYSMDSVHATNGEHPIGLAADLVPNKAAGGTWNDIDRLAAWAEPTQNNPRAPFRWVGYNGDAGHGRGNHLHLSWNHSTTKPGIPATTVDTIFCPAAPSTTPTTTTPPAPPTGSTTPTGGGGHRHHGGGGHHHGTGTDAQTQPTSEGGPNPTTTSNGGISRGGSGTGGVRGRAAHAPSVLPPAGPGFNDL
jgi:hypothetical protein